MHIAHENKWQAEAIANLDRQQQHVTGDLVVRRLTDGLDLLRDTLYRRVHSDVQVNVGLDSMLIPTSEIKGALATKWEIDVYMISASARAVGDWDLDLQWYLSWLTRLRLGDRHPEADVQAQLEEYVSVDTEQSWLDFSDTLGRVMPESRKAPVVLIRLFTPAVQMATAVAFDDPLLAGEYRNRQAELLPVISECNKCHGAVLNAGESCVECGNPLWSFEWLRRES